MTVLIYEGKNEIVTYTGTPPDVGEEIYVLDHRDQNPQMFRYTVKSRTFTFEIDRAGRQSPSMK